MRLGICGGTKIKQLKKYLVVVLGIAMLMVLAMCASTLYQSYRQTRLSAVANAGNVTLISQRAISRNLEVLSLSLDTLAYRYQHPLGARRLEEAQRYAYLFGSAASVSHIVVMAVIGPKGEVLASSRRRPGEPAPNYGDRAYFTAHRDADNVGLYVSRPIQASLGNELQVVVLSKRLFNDDGSFGGVVVMALDLAYFRDLFEGLSLGADGVISLYSDDGVAYMRVPYRDEVIGRDLSGSANFQRIKSALQHEEGSFFARANSDGVERLYTFRRIPDSPLIVFVGYSQEAIFKSWRKTLYAVILSLFIFTLLLAYLLSHVRHELRRRVSIERRLEELALTDGLTGLLNRRALDDALQATWERCRRNLNSTFSVLFIDVDYFKLYNDSYGHKLGDEVLREVAQAINENLPRNTDCAGRYGGEEFVVLLELTEEQGALLMAQRLCDAVYSRLIVHATSPLRVVTISVGVATLQRGHHRRVEDVLNAADAALYRAKRDGRNAVRVSGVE
ncbi:sensor domain-containing diguanylate cyclase [Herbaspirillum huttiense]|uniref:sensor domain-containing diguanylate cyclase n=1 Tax=Herbaspirillum huttiense TaxID=863372 RepID=UPI00041976C1|nr:sensor domain-containing diguanylate cyclase [Herbaspirillum huttiense]